MRHRRGIDLTGGSNDNLPPKPTGIFVPQRGEVYGMARVSLKRKRRPRKIGIRLLSNLLKPAENHDIPSHYTLACVCLLASICSF